MVVLGYGDENTKRINFVIHDADGSKYKSSTITDNFTRVESIVTVESAISVLSLVSW